MAARMLKYSWLVFLIGLSAAAHALTGTSLPVDVPITITAGSTVPCDIGPPFTGSIPTPAQEAGFTYCVANLDWSNAQFANPNTWLADCGASSPLLWFFTNNGVRAACARAHMVDDTANGGGAQVLQLDYLTSDYDINLQSTWLSLSTNVGDPHPAGLTMFPGYYAQYVMRLTSGTWNNSVTTHNAIMADVWSYPVNNSCNGVGGVPVCDVIMEQDFVEFQGQAPSTKFADAGFPAGNANSFNGIFTGNQLAVSYNTLGFLNTAASSGSPNFAGCYFVNGANITTPCRSTTLASVDLNNYDDIFPGQMGPQKAASDGNVCSPGSVSCKPDANQSMLERSFQIWACPGYKTGPCFGTLVTNP